MASWTPEVTAASFTKGSLTTQAGNTSFPISLGNNRLFPGISRLLDYLGEDKQPGKIPLLNHAQQKPDDEAKLRRVQWEPKWQPSRGGV